MTRSTFPQSKITPAHLRRQALIYIRQSSTQQVRSHQESKERQYALVQRAAALGWTPETIATIDEDQGRSGTSAVHRPGFKKLVAEISAGQVGIVLALEASRLARSSADWHRLVEICSITRTLLADDGAVYDPREPNDRLLLGVKGTLSEAELFTLRCRLHEGRWNKARRGALMRSLPVGYVARADGTIQKDPDRQVQARLAYVFRLFTRLRVARQVLVQLRTEDLKLPTQVWGGPQHGRVVWKAPTLAALVRLFHNPTYAGVYVYGQFAYDPFARSATTGKAKTHVRPLEEWPVCLHAAFPASISWDQFVDNQRVLRANWYRADRRGAPRKGAALLQGVVFCGRCGHKMRIQHYATREKRAPAYTCYHAYQAEGGVSCQCMSAHGVDTAVTGLFLQAVSPAKVDIALRALQELEHERAAARDQWALQLQQADYEVQVAQRRYETVDPANRLVAGELEAQWEAALKHRETLRRRSQAFARQQEHEIGPKECALIQELAADMERVWSASTTTMEDRKTLLRYLVKRVHLDGVTEPGRIQIEVEWHTGAHTSTTIERPLVGAWAPRTPAAVEQRIQTLLPTHTQTQIAHSLNAEGFRSAKGKAFHYSGSDHRCRRDRQATCQTGHSFPRADASPWRSEPSATCPPRAPSRRDPIPPRPPDVESLGGLPCWFRTDRGRHRSPRPVFPTNPRPQHDAPSRMATGWRPGDRAPVASSIAAHRPPPSDPNVGLKFYRRIPARPQLLGVHSWASSPIIWDSAHRCSSNCPSSHMRRWRLARGSLSHSWAISLWPMGGGDDAD